MKKLSNLLIALTLLSAFFVACEEDPVIPPTPVGPTIEFSAGAGTVSGPTDVAVGESFIVTVVTAAGDENISQIVVEENGSAIDAGRLTLEGNAAGGNPSPIDPSFGAGFTWEVGITTSDVVDATVTYTIRITDAAGLSDELSVDITQFSSISEDTVVLLKNQGGPKGTGGVDLHTGTGTGTQVFDDANGNPDSTYLTADLRDMGNDAGFNWIQKIGVINGSQLVIPAASFDYDAVISKSELVTAFEAGTEITESDVVAIDDVFLVKSDGTYFAVKVTDVVATPTIGDNTDYYELSVKQ